MRIPKDVRFMYIYIRDGDTSLSETPGGPSEGLMRKLRLTTRYHSQLVSLKVSAQTLTRLHCEIVAAHLFNYS